MKCFIYILIGVLTFLIGISFIQITYKRSVEVVEVTNQEIQLDVLPKHNEPRFLQLGGFGSYGSFKSSGSEPRFSDDCIGCGEIGDISIYHNSQSPEQTSYTLKANCVENKHLVEKGFQLNENGQKIGERCLIGFPGADASIFWTEGKKDYWIISATSLNLVKEFESSEAFRLWKSGKSDEHK